MSQALELQLRLAAIALDGSMEDSPKFPTHKNPAHSWSEQQQRFICVLKRWFVVEKNGIIQELSGSDLRAIFLSVYKADLPVGPRGQTISTGAVASQLKQIRKDGRKRPAWRYVFRDTRFNDPFSRYKRELIDIYQAGLHLDLDLVPRDKDDVTTAARESVRHAFDQRLSKLCHVNTSMDDGFVTQSSSGKNQYRS